MNVPLAARLAPIAAWLVGTPSATAAPSPVARARAQHAAARAMCEIHGIDVQTRGAPPEGPALLVANHIGYFDPMVVGAIAACVSIAKRELRSWPIVGRRLRDMGVVFVDRSDPWSGARALRAMLRAFRLGASVLNFPEGTTTSGAAVLPFRAGAFGAAQIAGVPVVPVRLDYEDPRVAWTGDATFLPHYVATLARGRVRARVSFGAPIAPRVSRGKGAARDLADAAREAVEGMRA